MENSWNRHKQLNDELEKGLTEMGFEYLVPRAERIPHMNVVSTPEGDEAKFRMDLLNKCNLEIGGGLGPLAGKYWRIGLMGYSCRLQNINNLFGSLSRVVKRPRPESYQPSPQI